MAKRPNHFHVMGNPFLRAFTKQIFCARLFMKENGIPIQGKCDHELLLQRLNGTNEITYSAKRWVLHKALSQYDKTRLLQDDCELSTIYDIIEHKSPSITNNMYIVYCNFENDPKLTHISKDVREEAFKVTTMLTPRIINDCENTSCDLVYECGDSKDRIDACLKWFDYKGNMGWKEINNISLDEGIIISTSTISNHTVSTASVKKLHRSIRDTDDVLSLTGQLLDRLAEDQEKWKNRRMRLDNKEVMDAFVAQRLKEMEDSARKRREERKLYPCKTPTYDVRRRRFRFSLIAILSKIWKMLPSFYVGRFLE